jgi:hypothetical protein
MENSRKAPHTDVLLRYYKFVMNDEDRMIENVGTFA